MKKYDSLRFAFLYSIIHLLLNATDEYSFYLSLIIRYSLLVILYSLRFARYGC